MLPCGFPADGDAQWQWKYTVQTDAGDYKSSQHSPHSSALYMPSLYYAIAFDVFPVTINVKRISNHLCPLLPPIRPTRTVHTPLRLLTNILPTKLALNLLLHNIIIRAPRIRQRNDPQRQRNAYEPNHLIQEAAVRKHNSPIVKCLFDGVVPVRYGAVVGWAVL